MDLVSSLFISIISAELAVRSGRDAQDGHCLLMPMESKAGADGERVSLSGPGLLGGVAMFTSRPIALQLPQIITGVHLHVPICRCH